MSHSITEYLFAKHARPEHSHSHFDDIAKKGKQKTKTSSKTNQSIGSDRNGSNVVKKTAQAVGTSAWRAKGDADYFRSFCFCFRFFLLKLELETNFKEHIKCSVTCKPVESAEEIL